MRLTIFFLLVSVCSFGQEKSPRKTINLSGLSYLYHAKSKDMVNIEQIELSVDLSTGEIIPEIWKDVVGYEGLYKISNYARLISYPKHKGRGNGYFTKEMFMNVHPDKDGYPLVVLCKECVTKTYRLHKLVATHFIPNPENKPQINHKKGIKSDARAFELEWVTQSENMVHAHKFGLMSMDHLIKYHTGRVRSNHKSAKELHQYSLSGEYIKSFPCVLDAVDATGARFASAAARGEQKTSGGFKWSYTKLES